MRQKIDVYELRWFTIDIMIRNVKVLHEANF